MNKKNFTPKKETHLLQKCEYQLADLRPILAFFLEEVSTSSVVTLAMGDPAAEPAWLAGAVGKSSTGLVGDKLCSLYLIIFN